MLFTSFWMAACRVDPPPPAPGKLVDASSDIDAEPDYSRWRDVHWMSDLPPNPLDAPTSGDCSVADPSSCAPGFICYVYPPSCSWLGQCQLLTESLCNERRNPVCGCDGRTYANSCDAYHAGTTVGPVDKCAAPAGHFPCGSEFCNPRTQYCQRTSVFDQKLIYRACNNLPPSCIPTTAGSKPDCACWPEMANQCTACRVLDGAVPGLEVDCPPVGG